MLKELLDMRRRTFFLILSPLIAIIIILSLLVGLLQSAGLLTLNFAASLSEFGLSPTVTSQAQKFTEFLSWLNLPFRILFIPVIFFLALIFHHHNWRIAGWLLDSPLTNVVRRPRSLIADEKTNESEELSAEEVTRHRRTLQHLVANLISLLAFSLAILLTLMQFITSAGLALVATVASTALGFGARDYINDLIMGITAIFEDNFDVGEKMEVLRLTRNLEGVVKKVNVRTATMVTPGGVPITVPHGEMRVFRNFSRGIYSSTSVAFHVPSNSLIQALDALEQLSAESMALFPDLIEPLQIISRSGVVGAQTELLVLGKAVYGRGVDLRLRLFAVIEERLQRQDDLPPI